VKDQHKRKGGRKRWETVCSSGKMAAQPSTRQVVVRSGVSRCGAARVGTGPSGLEPVVGLVGTRPACPHRPQPSLPTFCLFCRTGQDSPLRCLRLPWLQDAVESWSICRAPALPLFQMGWTMQPCACVAGGAANAHSLRTERLLYAPTMLSYSVRGAECVDKASLPLLPRWFA
jgi:hypothetical protein